LKRGFLPFGAKFLRVGRKAHEGGVEPVSNLDQLLPSADIVVLTIPLTSETRHRFDRKRLARMKPGRCW
jgi:phosphoglycerate dehydrogenase-like enzyme